MGEIHYDEPSDAKHPLSFVIDEIIPVSRWYEAGYDSPEAAADDWNNLQPAHYICNQMKGNRLGFALKENKNASASRRKKKITLDGKW